MNYIPDISARNWWRDLEPDDYDDREILQSIIDALANDVTRMNIEIQDAKLTSEQGGHVDAEWHRALLTVYGYAKDKRKLLLRKMEMMNRAVKDEEFKRLQERQERILFALSRVEALLDRLEGRV